MGVRFPPALPVRASEYQEVERAGPGDIAAVAKVDDLHIGGSFNTIIGLIFLLIVIVSPDGLVGLWDRLWGRIQGGGDSDATVAPVTPAGAVPREV